MILHGEKPFINACSKGDKRFSAFFAYVNGKSIEETYQAAKIFEDGSTGLSWKEAKGRKAVNMEYVAELYSKLWDQYIEEHPELHDVLRNCKGIFDIFGQPGHVCQATELWRIKCQKFSTSTS